MKVVASILVGAVVAFVLVSITDHTSSSKLPPCDLVTKGIGISTYGCSNSTPASYPCMNDTPHSSTMKSCVEKHYYLIKTFPFGFTQYFDASHNLATPNDSKVRNKNRITTFGVSFVVVALLTYAAQALVSKKPSVSPSRDSTT